MREYAIKIVITEYGNEMIPANFWIPLKSPAKRVIPEMLAIKMPQTNNLLFEGFISPLLDSMPRTNVPELAEVIRKVATKRKQRIVVKAGKGYIAMRSHSAMDILFMEESARAQEGFFIIASIEAVPKIAIQAKLPSGGTIKDPITSSFIVLPEDILAKNTPQRGPQESHHNQ